MLEEELKKIAASVMQQSGERIARCMSFLDEDEVWRDFNPHLVSVGNLILHLIGNLSQHVISGLGNESYTRQRDREFSDKPNLGKRELLEIFSRTVDRAARVVETLQVEDLTKRYIAQGHECSGAEDLITVIEHLSYHTGQLTFAVKYLKKVDVGYYAGVDLNQQNRPGAME